MTGATNLMAPQIFVLEGPAGGPARRAQARRATPHQEPREPAWRLSRLSGASLEAPHIKYWNMRV